MTSKDYDIGVIVGRFQVSELTFAHRKLIDEVYERCSDVLVLLGYSDRNPTKHDPLDIETRKKMILESYPLAIVSEIKDHPSDSEWSKALDKKIEEAVIADKICLFGGRDSFIPRYNGKYKTHTIKHYEKISGTESRGIDFSKIPDTIVGRSAAIYAAGLYYPTSYQTVDIAVVQYLDGKPDRVLMGQRYAGAGYMFPGGFVDTADLSLEMAALRELSEEVHVDVHSDEIRYIGSNRQKDYRYRQPEEAAIMTALFMVPYLAGPGTPKSEFKNLDWMLISPKTRPEVVESHQPLFDLLLKAVYHE